MSKKCQASTEVDGVTYACERDAHRGPVCRCGDVRFVVAPVLGAIVRLVHHDPDKTTAERDTCSAVVYTPRPLRRARLHTCTLDADHGRDHLDETSGHAWKGGIAFVPPSDSSWRRWLSR
ncbi:hypothetical protein ABGB12_34840 [Actinocorallia sp. B10E7]|uniref:hypothetical protein n=1 Tax=Actinocorallia sp. B10E7 TaxID=3153558 RepID=UPI00325D8F8E